MYKVLKVHFNLFALLEQRKAIKVLKSKGKSTTKVEILLCNSVENLYSNI